MPLIELRRKCCVDERVRDEDRFWVYPQAIAVEEMTNPRTQVEGKVTNMN